METYIIKFAVDIDRCVHAKNEYDFAILIHKCFKDYYVYENHDWYKIEGNEKIKDNKAEKLTEDIRTIITEILVKRSEYWEHCSKEETDTNIKSDNEMKSSLLIKNANKLKTNQIFVKNIIKECKSFFYIS
tara:strand:- start:10320 stop:10712 length:393 start_codon:yes stop_codon:yes gene_type:complete